MPHILALYEIDRAFGGTEEGGWFYDCGQLVKILAVDHDKERAMARCNRMNRWLDRLQRNRRPVSSVAYDGGRYQAMTYQDVAPAFFPRERPIYQ